MTDETGTLLATLKRAWSMIESQDKHIRGLMYARALENYRRPPGRPRRPRQTESKPSRSTGRPRKWPDLVERIEPYKKQLRESGAADTDIAAVKMLMLATLKVEDVQSLPRHQWRKDFPRVARNLSKRLSDQRRKLS